MIDKFMYALIGVFLMYITVSLYIANEQLKAVETTVDEINIMLKDFNNG